MFFEVDNGKNSHHYHIEANDAVGDVGRDILERFYVRNSSHQKRDAIDQGNRREHTYIDCMVLLEKVCFRHSTK